MTQIVEASLDYPDAERLFDRSNLRVTGRAMAVERHGEDFVSEFEAKLRERAAKAELRLDQS